MALHSSGGWSREDKYFQAALLNRTQEINYDTDLLISSGSLFRFGNTVTKI
jgi:hypothetical protein